VLILLSFIKIQKGGLNLAILLDQLTWNDPPAVTSFDILSALMLSTRSTKGPVTTAKQIPLV